MSNVTQVLLYYSSICQTHLQENVSDSTQCVTIRVTTRDHVLKRRTPECHYLGLALCSTGFITVHSMLLYSLSSLSCYLSTFCMLSFALFICCFPAVSVSSVGLKLSRPASAHAGRTCDCRNL